MFRAVDPNANNTKAKFVALKVTTPGMMSPPHDSRREALILSAAANEHVIPLLETFEQSGGHYVLAFPYMPCSLNDLLRQHFPLPAVTQKMVLRSLFSALAHIHALGIIHRDIKPSNILLSSATGPAYLADFGIAWSPSHAESSEEPQDGKVLDVGTTSYRPPELLFGCTSYTSSLDLWAAGCVAAQVISLGSTTLFDSGDLGSELALIKSMFNTLGTPNESDWPGAREMPDWGKMRFTVYPRKPWEGILPGCGYVERDLVARLVVFEAGGRIRAEEALGHTFFQQ